MSDREPQRSADAPVAGDGAVAIDDRPPADGLIVVCGLPGVGKTTVARRIAERADATILRTDAVRKELFSDPDYTDEENAAVYAELLSRAADVLREDGTIVLDATFAESSNREDARAVAEELDVPFELVKVECASDVVEERIQQRDGLSDADFEIHCLFREEFDPIEIDHETVDNSGPETETLDQVDDLF